MLETIVKIEAVIGIGAVVLFVFAALFKGAMEMVVEALDHWHRWKG